MARYRHPRALGVADPPQFAVDIGGDHVDLDADGCFETDDEAAVRAIASAHDVSVAELRVEGDDTPAPLGATAADMIDRGVCPWCSDYEGDHVGQHASSAHPDEWADYTEGDT